MASVARRRGWPILQFNSRGSGGVMGQVRTLLGIGALVPAATTAISWGLLTAAGAAGQPLHHRLPAVAAGRQRRLHQRLGRDNLTAKRPAVFIFNHRNNFDPVIVGGLVKDNWTGVGKKELKAIRSSARWARSSTPYSSTAMTRSLPPSNHAASRRTSAKRVCRSRSHRRALG